MRTGGERIPPPPPPRSVLADLGPPAFLLKTHFLPVNVPSCTVTLVLHFISLFSPLSPPPLASLRRFSKLHLVTHSELYSNPVPKMSRRKYLQSIAFVGKQCFVDFAAVFLDSAHSQSESRARKMRSNSLFHVTCCQTPHSAVALNR